MDYATASEEILQLLGGSDYKPNAQNQKLADLGMVNMLTGGKGARGRVGGVMYDQAMTEREKGSAQKLTLARLTAEQKRWQAEQERMAKEAERQAKLDEQRLGLDRARLGIEQARAAKEDKGSWQKMEDPYTGETYFLNLTTGDARDSMGRPLGAGGGGGQPQPQPQQAPRQAPTSGAISGGAAQGMFGMPAPQVGGAQFAGGPTPQAQPPQAAPRPPVSRVLFKDRPQVEGELQKTTAILRQLAGLEQLYGASGGTGFGRGISLPTKAAQQYDAGVAQLAPELFKMARTPGEGAQSDFEAKMKMMGMPYRVMPGDYTGVPENQLKGSQAELRRRLEERVQVLAAQLGMSEQDVQAMIEGTRGAPAQAGGGQGRTMTYNPQTGRVE